MTLRWLPDTMSYGGTDIPSTERHALPMRDASHVDGLEAPPELHVQRERVCIDGREWHRCSCGLVVEIFFGGDTCPIEDARADLQEAIGRATDEYTKAHARCQAGSDRAKAELADALESERR